jgi:hypothetical protein
VSWPSGVEEGEGLAPVEAEGRAFTAGARRLRLCGRVPADESEVLAVVVETPKGGQAAGNSGRGQWPASGRARLGFHCEAPGVHGSTVGPEGVEAMLGEEAEPCHEVGPVGGPSGRACERGEPPPGELVERHLGGGEGSGRDSDEGSGRVHGSNLSPHKRHYANGLEGSQ